jgi:hypothetical protein
MCSYDRSHGADALRASRACPQLKAEEKERKMVAKILLWCERANESGELTAS